MDSLRRDLHNFPKFLGRYCQAKVFFTAASFEKFKNKSVDILMLKRGVLQTKIWHGSMVGLSAFGLLTSGIFGGRTIISSSYPGIGGEDPRFVQAASFAPDSSDPVLNSLYDTHTQISVKPRAEIIDYEVNSGDTLSSISKKFDISVETIKWSNNLDDVHAIKPGQVLKILPLSGVSHKVVSGDSLESVAKVYSANSQAILDYPFNDIPDDFKLKIGQVLIVPDGVPPQKAAPAKSRPAPQYLAQGPSSPTFNAPGGGSFIWPTRGGLTQYFSWYHPGIDVADRSAPGIVASDGGVVIVAGWPDNFGFGNRVVVDHENGYRTTYAHLSNIYVTTGQKVSRGQIIGQMGSTGRSTGTHLHLEIRFKGIAVNPLSILK